MKVLCPGCGLGGTAEVEVFEKKVRCPQCRIIFRITPEVVVGLAQNGFEVIQQSIDSEEGIDEEQTAVRQDGSEASQIGGAICSRCGFTLSDTFIRFIEDRPVCLACAG